MSKKIIKIQTVNATKTMLEAREEFILNGKARNLANDTIMNYEKVTRYFMEFIGEDFNIYDLTKADVDSYIMECLKRAMGNTVRAYCKLLKVFFRFHALDIQVDMPSENFMYKEAYTDEEISLLIEPPKKKTFVSMRDHAIICFLLSTGVRRSTLVNIRIKDLNFKDNLIFLEKTKTKKQYHIPMSTQLKRILKQYLSVWIYNVETDYLFPNQFGEQLGKHGITLLINRYNKSRGVTTTGVHRFRNTYATNYIKNKGDVFRLQQLLGHSKIETTRRYVTLDIEDLKQDYDNFNVLDQFENKRISARKKIITRNKKK